MTVKLLAMAHEQNCEDQLAIVIGDSVNSGVLPDADELKGRFTMKAGALQEVSVKTGEFPSYTLLFGFMKEKGGKI